MNQRKEIEFQLTQLLNLSRDALEAFQKGKETEFDYTSLYRRMQGAQRIVMGVREKAHASAYVLKEYGVGKE